MTTATTTQQVLSIKNLSVSYSGKQVVRDINFSLRRGEILAIVGESGSGKSTILKAIAAVSDNGLNIDEGQIIFNGDDITRMDKKSRRRLAGKSIAMIFQNSAASFCPIRKIGEQIYESVCEYENRSQQEFRAKAAAIMEQIHLSPSALDEYPFRLSGGMGQRAGILAAMILEPSLLLADEPTSALDTITQASVVEELIALRNRRSISMITVTHNMGVARRMADTILIMRQGQMVEYGTKEQIFQTPQKEYTKELINAAPKLSALFRRK